MVHDESDLVIKPQIFVSTNSTGLWLVLTSNTVAFFNRKATKGATSTEIHVVGYSSFGMYVLLPTEMVLDLDVEAFIGEIVLKTAR